MTKEAVARATAYFIVGAVPKGGPFWSIVSGWY